VSAGRLWAGASFSSPWVLERPGSGELGSGFGVVGAGHCHCVAVLRRDVGSCAVHSTTSRRAESAGLIFSGLSRIPMAHLMHQDHGKRGSRAFTPSWLVPGG
jgi:hypothetical protein